jgi:hypothetical protein
MFILKLINRVQKSFVGMQRLVDEISEFFKGDVVAVRVYFISTAATIIPTANQRNRTLRIQADPLDGISLSAV